MPRICVFDVNETLLDLSALGPHFYRAFGDAGVRCEWFQQVLQSALVATILGAYAPFDRIQSAALEMIAQRHGVQLAEDDRVAILEHRQSNRIRRSVVVVPMRSKPGSHRSRKHCMVARFGITLPTL